MVRFCCCHHWEKKWLGIIKAPIYLLNKNSHWQIKYAFSYYLLSPFTKTITSCVYIIRHYLFVLLHIVFQYPNLLCIVLCNKIFLNCVLNVNTHRLDIWHALLLGPKMSIISRQYCRFYGCLKYINIWADQLDRVDKRAHMCRLHAIK